MLLMTAWRQTTARGARAVPRRGRGIMCDVRKHTIESSSGLVVGREGSALGLPGGRSSGWSQCCSVGDEPGCADPRSCARLPTRSRCHSCGFQWASSPGTADRTLAQRPSQASLRAQQQGASAERLNPELDRARRCRMVVFGREVAPMGPVSLSARFGPALRQTIGREGQGPQACAVA